ncbi:MAG: nickel-dependent hydrogenase large subunit [Planctomycetota bacterium]
MATTFTIDPVSRIEGHLKIEVTVDTVGGEQQVIDAKSSGTMFRGFENILIGRSPLDAPHITQRICGVCPVSHGMASCKTIEDALPLTPPANGRILRNLVLGANFIQSHILHFYHLAALDYLNTTGILDMPPWSYRYVTADMASGADAEHFVTSYLQALAIRRKAHQMGAIFGGKLPCCTSFNPGGCTDVAETGKIDDFRTLLTEIRTFIDTVFIPDVQLLGGIFSNYFGLGSGCGKLISYGVFDLDSAGTTKFLDRGIYDGSAVGTMDPSLISEYVGYSNFTSPSNLHPSVGETAVVADKVNAYSYIKAPRYGSDVYEAGPLARMKVSGHYSGGISSMDRIVARAEETKLIADAMDGWLNDLTVGADSYTQPTAISATVSGEGLTEAPRGALGHWISIGSDSKTSRYQVITPTAWNCSPMDDSGNKGPVEQALIGTPVNEVDQPVEILRVIHSFDPCLACSVHMLRPDETKPVQVIDVPAGL